MRLHSALSLCAAAGTLAAGANDDLAQADLEKLRDPKQREAEVQRIISAQDAKTKTFLTNFRFLEAPQRDGAPLHVLLAGYDYDFQREEESDKPWFRGYRVEDPDTLFAPPESPGGESLVRGTTTATLERIVDNVLIVLDAGGAEVRPFGGNNYVDDGVIADLNGDRLLERADVTHYRVTKEVFGSVLEVSTVEVPPQTLLRVVTHWDHRGDEDSEEWTFQCRDLDDDGLVELVLTPREAGESPASQVVFRWNNEAGQFVPDDLSGTPLQVFGEGEKLKDLYPKRPAIARKPPPAPLPQVAEAVPAGKPFVYKSLQNVDDAGILAFFSGRPARDHDGFADEDGDAEDSALTHLPENFWNLDPKAAAMKFVETNRTRAHRETYALAVDDRHGIAPPESGWLVHDYHSAACYTYTTHQFALRFGIDQPFLMHIEHSSQGIVGANPLVDRAGYAMRLLPIPAEESRFLVDTVFWLDRIRARGSSNSGGGMSSSADGHARLTIFEDGKAPRDVADDTIWTTMSIPARWTNTYEPETCVNFVEFLLDSAWRDRLGDRWNTVAPLVHRNLATPVEERLKPRQDRHGRELLADLAREAFAIHERDPLPPSILLDLVRSAGSEGLFDLLDPIRKLAASLPPLDAEDREFDQLATRFARDHFGNYLGDNPEDEDKRAAWKRYQDLLLKRRHQPGPVLREATAFTIRQLESVDRPDLLMTWARGLDHGNAWALQRLESHYPDAHADILREAFEEADIEARRRIFTTLAAANPQAAAQLRDSFRPEELQALILEVAKFESKHDPARLATRAAGLFRVVASPDPKKPWLRGTALKFLAQIDLDTADRKRLDEILLAEFTTAANKNGKAPEEVVPGIPSSNLPEAVEIILQRRPDRERYWEPLVVASMTVRSYFHFEVILNALYQFSEIDRANRRAAMEELIRHRLTESDGMMNAVFFSALAFDLRDLASDFAAMATDRPGVRDGLGADFSGGKFDSPAAYRYHAAREVLALWAEPDPATRARMWIALVLKRPYRFDGRRDQRPGTAQLRKRAAEEIRHLPPTRRQTTTAAMLEALPPGTEIPAETRDWLESLAP